jgi:hypothetical protein
MRLPAAEWKVRKTQGMKKKPGCSTQRRSIVCSSYLVSCRTTSKRTAICTCFFSFPVSLWGRGGDRQEGCPFSEGPPQGLWLRGSPRRREAPPPASHSVQEIPAHEKRSATSLRARARGRGREGGGVSGWFWKKGKERKTHAEPNEKNTCNSLEKEVVDQQQQQQQANEPQFNL